MIEYAIFNPEKGYMYEDEDRLPGSSTYDHEIDFSTITFNSAEDAQRNCDKDDMVVILENRELVGVFEVKKMTREEIKLAYGKSFE